MTFTPLYGALYECMSFLILTLSYAKSIVMNTESIRMKDMQSSRYWRKWLL